MAETNRDVSGCIRHFMRDGVVIKTVINGMSFDGQTQRPDTAGRAEDALIAFMAAMAEAQAVAAKEAQRARIAAAKAKGRIYRGRKPSFDRKQLEIVNRMLLERAGASAISKMTGLTRQAILRFG